MQSELIRNASHNQPNSPVRDKGRAFWSSRFWFWLVQVREKFWYFWADCTSRRDTDKGSTFPSTRLTRLAWA